MARFGMLKLAASMVNGLPGSVAEVGVFKGKGAFYIAGLFPDKTLHLFDTFTGMPDTIEEIDGGGWEKYRKTSLEIVQHKLKDFDNVQIHPGFFPDTGVVLPASESFCLVHVDVDLYRSTLDVCSFFYDRMVPGGIMVLNDYKSPECPGATKAVDEFFADKSEKVVSRGLEHTWVIKL